MGFDKMNWIKYLFNNLKKITALVVTFSLITKSGNKIHEIIGKYEPNNILIKSFYDFGYFEIVRELEKEEYWKNIFDKKAEELLDTYQKVQRNKLKRAVLDGGDYIIKCEWDLYLKYEPLDYKEYKNYIIGKSKNG